MSEEMDERTNELIAIGASIGAYCQHCLAYHVGKAKELGIDAELIRRAIYVGHMVEKGAMTAMREFAKGVLDAPMPGGAACCAGKTTNGKSCCK